MVVELVTWKKFNEGEVGWVDAGEVNHNMEIIKSVGLRKFEDAEVLVLGQSYDQEDDMYQHVIVIPKVAIMNRQIKQEAEM